MALQLAGKKITEISSKILTSANEYEINNTIDLTDVHIVELRVGGTKQKGLNITFTYKANYNQGKVGEIIVKGTIFLIGEEKEVKEFKDNWSNDKKIDPKLRVGILNQAWEISFLEAAELSKKLGLPLPIKIPTFALAEKEVEKKIKK